MWNELWIFTKLGWMENTEKQSTLFTENTSKNTVSFYNKSSMDLGILSAKCARHFPEKSVCWTNRWIYKFALYLNHYKLVICSNSCNLLETWSFFRGDRVEVLVGRDKGKQGFVSQIIQERNWVIVEGLNCHYRVMGRDAKADYPGIVVKSEAPLLVNNLYCFFYSHLDAIQLTKENFTF